MPQRPKPASVSNPEYAPLLHRNSPPASLLRRFFFASQAPAAGFPLYDPRRYASPAAVPPLQVIAPLPTDPNGPFRWDTYQDHIKIDVWLNRPVRKESVVPGSSLILSFSKDANADLLHPPHWAPTANGPDSYFYVLTKKTWDDLFQGGPRDVFTITLIGNNTPSVTAITDQNGVPLDGDNDGNAGGDYLMYFVLIG